MPEGQTRKTGEKWKEDDMETMEKPNQNENRGGAGWCLVESFS